MTPITTGFLGFGVMLALLAFGLPVAVGMALVGFGGIWYLTSDVAALTKIGHAAFNTVASWDFAVLPMFLFMAQITFSSGLSKDMYNLAAKWLGHQKGGIAMATVAGCAGFASVSASSIATASTFGLVALPEMRRYKYDMALATGCIAAGGTMGSLIPPSGILIVYGIITQTSIGKLFMAGIIPGILEAVFYIITIYIVCTWKPNLGPRGPQYSWGEKFGAFKSCGEIIALILFVFSGILFGWFTPTEAGAVGSVGAILFSLIRKRLNWTKFMEALKDTMKTTGMIYAIIIGASIFNYFLATSTIPLAVSDYIVGLHFSPIASMILVMVVYLILGCFIDTAAMVLITVPIFFPLILSLGFEPIWFGIIVVRMSEIGMITPPVGMNVYVIAGVAKDVPMATIFRGIVPFLISDILNVTLLLLVPAIPMILPKLM
jgi:C4-dicarboxylate transporter, DctM subunit